MRMLRTPRTTDQFCQISESTLGSDFAANTAPVTQIITTNGGLFPRSAAMAQLFQQMRIVQVIYTYEPLYNLFQGLATASPGTSVPDFYWLMDRQGGYLNVASQTVEALVSGGARPIKFTKNVTIKYKPNTLGLITNYPLPYHSTSPSSSGYLNADIQFDKWFSTSVTNTTTSIASEVAYYGHIFYVDQDNATAPLAAIGRVTVTVVTQFRQPFYPAPAS